MLASSNGAWVTASRFRWYDRVHRQVHAVVFVGHQYWHDDHGREPSQEGLAVWPGCPSVLERMDYVLRKLRLHSAEPTVLRSVHSQPFALVQAQSPGNEDMTFGHSGMDQALKKG